MIDTQFDLKGIETKLRRTERRYKAAVAQGLQDGFADVVADSPVDTGFFAASWFVSVDGSGRTGEAPDYGLKRQHDNARPFRNIGGVDRHFGQGRSLPPGVEALPKPEAQFMAIAADVTARFAPLRAEFNRGVTSREVSFINDAPYADVLDSSYASRAAAVTLVQNAIRSRLRAAGRARR